MANTVNEIELIGGEFKEDYIYIDNIGFYKWNDLIWERISESNYKREVLKIVKTIMHAEDISNGTIESIAKLSQLELFKTLDEMDLTSSSRIVFNNGTYNIKESNFEEGVFYKDDFTTKIMNCGYNKGSLTSWKKYCQTTFNDAETIMLVQEMMGYVLYPECTFEKSFILHGSGANGKSVLLNTVQELIGNGNTSYISMKDLEKSFLRSNLLGKSLNISSELEKSVGKTENFKKLVSGESVEAQFKYKDSFHFKNKAKLLFAMNQLSFINDLSDGLFRRLVIIPFENQFMKENRDPHLFDKINLEKDAIAEWSIRGLKRLIANNGNFTYVQAVEDMSKALKDNSNPILRFMEEGYEITNDEVNYISKMELYTEYRLWCEENGNKAMNSNNF